MITLTIKEIKYLAEFAGFTLHSRFLPDEDEMEADISITTEPRELTDDSGRIQKFAHVAWFSDYPEEGGIPLGDPL